MLSLSVQSVLSVLRVFIEGEEQICQTLSAAQDLLEKAGGVIKCRSFLLVLRSSFHLASGSLGSLARRSPLSKFADCPAAVSNAAFDEEDKGSWSPLAFNLRWRNRRDIGN